MAEELKIDMDAEYDRIMSIIKKTEDKLKIEEDFYSTLDYTDLRCWSLSCTHAASLDENLKETTDCLEIVNSCIAHGGDDKWNNANIELADLQKRIQADIGNFNALANRHIEYFLLDGAGEEYLP